MKTLKGMIEGAGLSRIYKHTQEKWCGTISAFRAYREGWSELSPDEKLDKGNMKDYKISYAENMKRHKLLGGLLQNKGINIISVDGVYEEAGTGKKQKESSYFCFADFDFGKVLVELGDKFEQDSITFAEPGGNFKLISSHDHYDGDKIVRKGELITTFNSGKNFGKDISEFYSTIRGRPFSWGGWDVNNAGKIMYASENKRVQSLSYMNIAGKMARQGTLHNVIAKVSSKANTIDELITLAKRSDII